MRDLVEDHVGTHEGEMILDPFASGDVPFQEPTRANWRRRSYIGGGDLSQDEHTEKRRAAVPQVEGLINYEAQIFMSWYQSRHVSPVIADLRRKLQQVVGLESEMALKRMEHLDPEHRKAMQCLVLPSYQQAAT